MSIFHRTIKFVMSNQNEITQSKEQIQSNNERNRTQKQISISQNNTTHLLSQEYVYIYNHNIVSLQQQKETTNNHSIWMDVFGPKKNGARRKNTQTLNERFWCVFYRFSNEWYVFLSIFMRWIDCTYWFRSNFDFLARSRSGKLISTRSLAVRNRHVPNGTARIRRCKVCLR